METKPHYHKSFSNQASKTCKHLCFQASASQLASQLTRDHKQQNQHKYTQNYALYHREMSKSQFDTKKYHKNPKNQPKFTRIKPQLLTSINSDTSAYFHGTIAIQMKLHATDGKPLCTSNPVRTKWDISDIFGGRFEIWVNKL